MAVKFDALASSINQVSSFQALEGVPSKEEAQKTFWGLGARFWMQMIDGKYHQHGPMVFDEALHGGVRESGFFASLKNGCAFAAEHFGEKLTVAFYKQLHKELCNHFKAEENNTEMSADQAGNFRDKYSRTRQDLQVLTDEAREHYLIKELHYWCFDENKKNEEVSVEIGYCINRFQRYHVCLPAWVEAKKEYWKSQTAINAQLAAAYQDSIKWIEEYELRLSEKIEKINVYLSEIAKLLSVKCVAQVSRIDDIIYVNYNNFKPEEFDRMVQILFDQYNQKIDELNRVLKNTYVIDEAKALLEEKIELIADLYQKLEWLHPFRDGNGRTDLVLQAKLLSEEGSNPAILDEPYTSTLSLLPEWREYLLKGIERWKEERLR